MQLQGHHGLLGIHALWVALPELTWRFASADPVDRRARRGARAGGQPREPGRRRGGASLFWGGHTKSQRPPDRESWAWGLSGVGPCGFSFHGLLCVSGSQEIRCPKFPPWGPCRSKMVGPEPPSGRRTCLSHGSGNGYGCGAHACFQESITDCWETDSRWAHPKRCPTP